LPGWRPSRPTDAPSFVPDPWCGVFPLICVLFCSRILAYPTSDTSCHVFPRQRDKKIYVGLGNTVPKSIEIILWNGWDSAVAKLHFFMKQSDSRWLQVRNRISVSCETPLPTCGDAHGEEVADPDQDGEMNTGS
jgi:hypothetical protein